MDLLAGLYQQALADGEDSYLRQHANRNSIRRQVAVFERYRSHLPSAGVFLDWGCRHAPDACLIREALGEDVELHGCDFTPPQPVFHEYAGLRYLRLTTSRQLPYGDEAFDVVIGSGVIEHTADDSLALREVHRVLKEDGLLVLTFIPNRLSLTEFVGRRMRMSLTHPRLYGRRQVRRMLLHHGFLPMRPEYHQMVFAHRAQRFGEGLWRFNSVLERLWPLNRLATNIMVVARRRSVMG